MSESWPVMCRRSRCGRSAYDLSFCLQGKTKETWSQREIHYKLGPPFVQFPPNQPGYALIRQEVLKGDRTVTLQYRKPLKPGQEHTDQEVGTCLLHVPT